MLIFPTVLQLSKLWAYDSGKGFNVYIIPKRIWALI